MPWYRGDIEFAAYVSVADRRARARQAVERIARSGKRALAPVGPLEGNGLARTFWGKAWCKNLESYSDYASRLGRGRSYTRHGAVIDLQIASGAVTALVIGSSMYESSIKIHPIDAGRWSTLAAACTGKIDSLVDLLKGRLSKEVMELVTRQEGGLFPAPGHISFTCSCPDWAGMCKHIAAVLYGVGVRLDEQPELLFALRGVDHGDLIGSAAGESAALVLRGAQGRKVIESPDLSALFGIDIEPAAAEELPAAVTGAGSRPKAAPPKRSAKTAQTRKTATKKASSKPATEKATTGSPSVKVRRRDRAPG
jgi:uncharacterized Zn finger protein